jgi:hypothetical protein
MDNFELALDDCLQQLSAGKFSLGQCLRRYPEYAAELRPLLEAALQLQRGKKVRPSGAARDRTRSKLTDYIEAHPRRPRNLKQVPRLVFVALSLVLALVVAVPAFAQDALPGQALYALKLTTERAWRAAAPDPAAADLTLADRRTDEILALANNQAHAARDDSSTLAESEGIAAYTDVLTRLETETTGPDGAHILKVLQAHQEKLLHAGIRVPELDHILLSAGSQNGGGHNTKP